MADALSVLGLDFDTSGLNKAADAIAKVSSAMDGLAQKASTVETSVGGAVNSAASVGQATTTSAEAASAGLQRLASSGKDAASAVSTVGGAGANGLKSLANDANTVSNSVHGTSGAIRELAVNMREIAAGNFSRLAGSFTILTDRLGLLNGQAISVTELFGKLGGIAGGLITSFAPLAITIGAISAALIGLSTIATAAFKGIDERNSLTNALTATGGAAGVTADQFDEMAHTISQSTNSSVEAIKSLELEAVKSGKVVGDNVGLIAQVAEEMSQKLGIEAPKALQQLIPLFDNTSEAAAKLNDQFHFLTLSQYEQIKALQESGDRQGAAKAALDAFNESLNKQATALSPLAQLWRNVTNAISGFLDKIGEAAAAKFAAPTPISQAQAQAAAIQGQIDKLQTFQTGTYDSQKQFQYAQEIAALQTRKLLIEGNIAAMQNKIATDAKDAAQQSQIIDIVSKYGDGQLTQLNAQKALLDADIAKKKANGTPLDDKGLQDELRALQAITAEIDRINARIDGKGRTKKQSDSTLDSMILQLQDLQNARSTAASGAIAGTGQVDLEAQFFDLTRDSIEKANNALIKYKADRLDQSPAGQLAAAKDKDDFDKAAKAIKDYETALNDVAKKNLQQQFKGDVATTGQGQGDFVAAVLQQELALVQQTNEFKKQGITFDAQSIAELIKKYQYEKQAIADVKSLQQQQIQNVKKSQDDIDAEQAATKAALNTNDEQAYLLAVAEYQLHQKNNLLLGDDLVKAAQRQVAEEKITQEQKIQQTQLASVGQQNAVNTAAQSLNAASNKFWDDFVINGGVAFNNLAPSLENIFRSTVANGLKAGFQPVLSWLQDQLSSVVKSVFSGVSSYFNSILKQSGILGADNKVTGTGQTITTLIGNAGIGSFLGGGIGQALGFSNGSAISQISGAVGGVAGGLLATGFAQGIIGGGLSSSFQLAFGAFAGPVGAVIGGLLGSAIGSIFSGGTTNAGAGQALNSAGGLVGGVQGNKRNQTTTNGLNAVVQAIQAGYTSLDQLGGTRSTYVTGVTVGQRDPSAITFSNGTSTTAAVGDATAAANAALLEVLRGTTFAVQGLNQIRDAMLVAGASFDSTDKILTGVKSILDSVAPPTSQWSKALTDLQAQFDPLIKSSNAAAAALLAQAEATAKTQIADAFNTDISNQLLKAQSSVAAQYHDMLQTQAQRIKDATNLGADLNQVMALNQQETTNFVASLFPVAKQTSTITDNIQALTTAFAQLSAQAVKAGQSTDQINQAYGAALDTLRAQYNQTTSDNLLQASNGTLYQLEQLLQTQKQRLTDAKALGVDLTATERLNAIETSNFFANLSATQKAQLGDYLGLIQDYTGKIGVVGTQLQDALTPIVSNMTSIINALNASAQTLRNLSLTISQTKDAIAQKYGAAAPTDALDALRAKFQQQAGLAVNGDQTALQGLSQLANTFIDASHALYGSTSKFVSDYDLVQSLLGQASQGAADAATQAENQAQALQTQINLLTDIKNILGDSQPQIATLQADYATLLASTTQVSATIAGILQQPNNGLTGVTTDVSTYQIGAQSITDLLGQYLALKGAQAGQTLNDTQLAQLSLLTAGSAANTTATNQATAIATATVPQANTSTVTPAPVAAPVQTPTNTTASDTTLATVTGYFQLLQQQIKADDASQLSVLQNLLTEFRKLTLYTQQSTAKA